MRAKIMTHLLPAPSTKVLFIRHSARKGVVKEGKCYGWNLEITTNTQNDTNSVEMILFQLVPKLSKK